MPSTHYSLITTHSRSVDEDLLGLVLVLALVHRLARLRAVIVAEPHHRPRLGQYGDNAVEQGFSRHRLLEELVDAEIGRLDHAPALDMAGQHDDGHVRNREHAG